MYSQRPGAVLAECYDARMSAIAPRPYTQEESEALLDRKCIDEIRYIERAAGRTDVLSGFVQTLERNIAGFGASFNDCVARGDTAGATRAAHSLKGACLQLGALALSDLFADIERTAKAGDYVEAMRRFDAGASLVARSLQALKNA
jgi:HPt (histidine-containing phosphotransfer) domain-containing protein